MRWQTLLLAALVFALPALAQDDESPLRAPLVPLVPDEARVIALRAEAATDLVYEAQGGESIKVDVRSADPQTLDPVLTVLDPGGRVIAYVDDTYVVEADGTRRVQVDVALGPLTLREAGPYTLRVDSFNGVSEGEVTVLLRLVDPFETSVEEETPDLLHIRARLPRSEVFRYRYEVGEGERLTITVRDLSFTLDPYLRVLDEDGAELAVNDDHGEFDLTLDVLDARLRDVALPAGPVIIEVIDFLARAGRFELIIERSE